MHLCSSKNDLMIFASGVFILTKNKIFIFNSQFPNLLKDEVFCWFNLRHQEH